MSMETFEKRGGIDHNGAGTGPGHTCGPWCMPAFRQSEARVAELEAALERLAKVDPFDESELPYITASRDLQARIEFARTALDSETKGKPDA